MTYSTADATEETKPAAWSGVTASESEDMDRQVQSMIADIRSLLARSQAADQHIRRASADTRLVLKQLMADLKIS